MSDKLKKKIIDVLTTVNKYVEDIRVAVETSQGSIEIPDPVTDLQQDPGVTNILTNIKDLLNIVITNHAADMGSSGNMGDSKQSFGGRRSSKKRGTQRKQKRRQRRGSRRAY